jgi:hypothetical protein
MAFDSRTSRCGRLKNRLSIPSWVLLTSQLFACVMCVSGFTGCTSLTGMQNNWSYNSGWNDLVAGYRNRAWSARAWNSRKCNFPEHSHDHEFAQGFRDGYQAVADGSDGCTPDFPPRKYWSWRYQSPEGQQKVASWFSGYPHGARAAEEDGVGYFTQIQTSNGIQREYAQAGLMPHEQIGMYPIADPDPYALPAPQGVHPEILQNGVPYQQLPGTVPVPE